MAALAEKTHADETIPGLPREERQSPAYLRRNIASARVQQHSLTIENPGRTSHRRTIRRSPFIGGLGGQKHTPTRQSLASPRRPRSTCTLVLATGSLLLDRFSKQKAQFLPVMIVIAVALFPLNMPKRQSSTSPGR